MIEEVVSEVVNKATNVLFWYIIGAIFSLFKITCDVTVGVIYRMFHHKGQVIFHKTTLRLVINYTLLSWGGVLIAALEAVSSLISLIKHVKAFVKEVK